MFNAKQDELLVLAMIILSAFLIFTLALRTLRVVLPAVTSASWQFTSRLRLFMYGVYIQCKPTRPRNVLGGPVKADKLTVRRILSSDSRYYMKEILNADGVSVGYLDEEFKVKDDDDVNIVKEALL